MSTAETGDAKVVADAVENAKELLTSERAEELRQMDLLDPPSPAEMVEAKEALGPNAGKLAILAEARARKRGRPPGARNKRTDDFKRWMLSLGPHPARVLMETAGAPTEVLMELSGKSWMECRDRQIRCAEALMPYFESKMPVAVDMTFTGVSDLVIEGVTHSRDEIGTLLDGEFLEVPDDEDRAA